MKIINQLLIFAVNKPGVLANICGSLTDEKVNILAISVVDHVDHALIRMVVDDSTRAIHLLGEAGLPVQEDQVIILELERGPGGLEKIANLLAEDSINIHYAYASESFNASNGDTPRGATLVLKTSSDNQAMNLLRDRVRDSFS